MLDDGTVKSYIAKLQEKSNLISDTIAAYAENHGIKKLNDDALKAHPTLRTMVGELNKVSQEIGKLEKQTNLLSYSSTKYARIAL